MQMVIAIIRLVGPLTTQELRVYCARYRPDIGYFGVQRMLTRMRRAHAVTGLPVKCRQRTVFWALPGQPIPKDADRRVQHLPVTTERRVLPDRRQAPRPAARDDGTGSWWVSDSREAFQAAARARWES